LEELGGESAQLSDVAEICSLIGQNCASSAMIYAMHNIKVSSLVSHGRDSNWHRGFMQRICEEQLLLASATTEGGIGGDLRNSICAVEIDGDNFKLGKDATVVSYGAHADAILVTARGAPDAPSSDQVMAVVLKDQCQLNRTTGWDTLGMRGTCSEGFRLDAIARRFRRTVSAGFVRPGLPRCSPPRISYGARCGSASPTMRWHGLKISPAPRQRAGPM
jgi:acyl-CoA dehydrogenase